MSIQIHSALGESEGIETPYADSPWVVMKFGGTSVATAENWARIKGLVEDRVSEGVRPFICHSALQGVSNRLSNLIETAVEGEELAEKLSAIREQHAALASDLKVSVSMLDEIFDTLGRLLVGVQLVREASPRVQARIMATGELAATRLGAAYLREQGLDVELIDATELLRALTDSARTERANFLSARCDYSPDPELQGRLSEQSSIVLTQGFIAHNDKNELVLLGRGGSDTSAAYFASKLEARRLEIWTDVPGFFSAEPKAVPSARLIRHMQYREAQELASAGGGILHPRSISPVRSTGIPLFLKCTTQPLWPGSVISEVSGEDSPQLKAVSHRRGIVLVSMESFEMWHQVGFLADAFACFKRHGISVDLISTSESNVTVSVDVASNVIEQSSLDALAADLRQLCRVKIIEDCAAITLVGRRIRTILHELAPALEVFEEVRVHLVTQAANDLNITFVVDAEHAHRLVQHIHGLIVGKFKGGVFGPTWEEFTGKVPGREEPEQSWWLRKRSKLIKLAREHGAAYVYDRESIVGAASALKALENVGRVFYAMKANSHPEVLRTIHERGIDIECVSPGEIARAREAIGGLRSDQILFTPNFAPRAEYEWALEEGVWLTLDNLYPLKNWASTFKGTELLIRIDTGQGRGHHEHVKTAGVHSKFGVPLFECEELADLVSRAGAKVVGLHAHTGSGVLNADAWRKTGETLASLREYFPDVRYMDLGGGLGVPERPAQRPLDMQALDSSIGSVKAASPGVEMWLEPGRFLVARAGVLLAQVTQLKGKGEVRYVGVNTGMNSLIRPALYGAYHDIVNLSRYKSAATELTTIVGPICETGDRLGSDRMLPAAEEGDVLLIANAGAYGYVMSSQYNLRQPATEVII